MSQSRVKDQMISGIPKRYNTSHNSQTYEDPKVDQEPRKTSLLFILTFWLGSFITALIIVDRRDPGVWAEISDALPDWSLTGTNYSHPASVCDTNIGHMENMSPELNTPGSCDQETKLLYKTSGVPSKKFGLKSRFCPQP